MLVLKLCKSRNQKSNTTYFVDFNCIAKIDETLDNNPFKNLFKLEKGILYPNESSDLLKIDR
ncbi:hypothetical protein GCM10022396_13740 [Flavivirga amylovorans]